MRGQGPVLLDRMEANGAIISVAELSGAHVDVRDGRVARELNAGGTI